jgi:O-methyltransferase involved in polyketide biosynthesis
MAFCAFLVACGDMTEGPQFLDTSRPNVARVYDYWLDGTDNFEADRELAERMLTIFPGMRELVRENRQFIARAVSWVAGQGIAQFIDAGAGLPTSPSTHESAHAVDPEARVVYLDNDPAVVAQACPLLADKGNGRVSVMHADLRDPAAVLTASGVDVGKPVCLILAAVLHLMDAESARKVTRGYVSRLAPGSYVIITMARYDDPVLAAQITETYTDAASFYNHPLTDAESFFAGLDLVEPGLVSGGTWRGGMPNPGLPRGKVYALAGVGCKPGGALFKGRRALHSPRARRR